jgi:hypothetical protein
LILEGPFLPRHDITPGLIWPLGGLGRTVVHWTYKPLDGSHLIDSIKLNFQMNTHSFCQWFALLAYYADHDDEFAKVQFSKLLSRRNIYNASVLTEWVQKSTIPNIVKLRQDMVYMPNAASFWNHGKHRSHYIGVDRMNVLLLKYARDEHFTLEPADRRRHFISEGLFFELLRKSLHELGDW